MSLKIGKPDKIIGSTIGYIPSRIEVGNIHADRIGDPVLDQIHGAIAAWSTRRLISSAPADIARGRDAATTEQDFTAAELAGTGFTDLAGAGDGFYVTLYDQIGSKNITQATAAAQPKGVSSGALIANGSTPVLECDGSDDILTNAAFVPSAFNSGTVFFQFKTSTRTGTPFLFGIGRNGTDIYIQISEFTGKAKFVSRVSFSLQCNINSNSAVDDGAWHSIATVWDVDDFKMYIDGAAQTETDTSGTTALTTGDQLDFGGAFSFQKYTGQLNNLIVFSRALTAEEISQLHTALI